MQNLQPPSPETRRVLDSIRRLVQGVRQASLNVEKQFGVSGAQLFVLVQLGEQAACSVNELTERTMTHQSSVSVVVAKLEKKGFVQRKRSAEDGRRLAISLTPKGRAIVKKAPPPFQARLAKGLSDLPAGEQRRLARALETINRAAGWHAHKPELFLESEAR